MRRISFLILIFPIFIWAQDSSSVYFDNTDVESISLEELMNIKISVATTKNTTIFNTPSTVSVIDRQMLDVYNFNDIAEALQLISGINIGRTTSRQQLPTSRWILQDHYPNKILVLINGIPQWNSVTGETGSLNRISVNDVERIEVLKGPASVLYGSNAYSGAINIVLHNKTKKTQGAIRGVGGSAANFNAGACYNYFSKDIGYCISFNSQREKGDLRTITDDQNVTGRYYDFINYSNLSATMRYKSHELLFNGYNESQQKLGVDPNFSSALGKPQNLYGYLLSYNDNLPLGKKVKWINQLSYDWQQRSFPRKTDLSIYTNMAGERISALSKFFFEPTRKLNAEIGISYDFRKCLYYTNLNVLKDSVITENNLKNKTISEAAGFAQMQYEFGKFQILAGDRFTLNNYFGNNNSTRGTLLMSINKRNTIKLIMGQSFRAPSMFETFYVNSTKSLGGNGHLKPETSTSYEIAYLTSFNKFIIQTLAYYADYKNKIFRENRPYAIMPDGSIGTATTKQYVNGHVFNATGVEFECKYQGKKLNAFVNYNYVIGTSGDTTGSNNSFHYNFKYIPKHTASAGIALLLGKWNISSTANYVSTTQGGKVSNGLSETIPDWLNIDFNTSYTHILGNTKLRHVISAKNILNNLYYQPEFVDRTLTSIPSGINRRINYTMILNF